MPLSPSMQQSVKLWGHKVQTQIPACAFWLKPVRQDCHRLEKGKSLSQKRSHYSVQPVAIFRKSRLTIVRFLSKADWNLVWMWNLLIFKCWQQLKREEKRACWTRQNLAKGLIWPRKGKYNSSVSGVEKNLYSNHTQVQASTVYLGQNPSHFHASVYPVSPVWVALSSSLCLSKSNIKGQLKCQFICEGLWNHCSQH